MAVLWTFRRSCGRTWSDGRLDEALRAADEGAGSVEHDQSIADTHQRLAVPRCAFDLATDALAALRDESVPLHDVRHEHRRNQDQCDDRDDLAGPAPEDRQDPTDNQERDGRDEVQDAELLHQRIMAAVPWHPFITRPSRLLLVGLVVAQGWQGRAG